LATKGGTEEVEKEAFKISSEESKLGAVKNMRISVTMS